MLNGAATASKTHTLKGVKTSTSWGEAEALHEATKQMVYLRGLLKEFGFSQEALSNPIFCDSQSVIAAINGEKQLKQAKQYSLAVTYVKEKVSQGLMHLRYCESQRQGADIMTKVTFPSIKHFLNLRNMVMGIDPHDIDQMEKNGRLLLSDNTDKLKRQWPAMVSNPPVAPKATEFFLSSNQGEDIGGGDHHGKPDDNSL